MLNPLVVVTDEHMRRVTSTHRVTGNITITVNKGIIEGSLNGVSLIHLKGYVTMTITSGGELQVSLIGYASGGRPRIVILGSRGVLEAIVPRVRGRNRRVIVIGRDIVSLLMTPDAVRVWFNPDPVIDWMRRGEAYAVKRFVEGFLGGSPNLGAVGLGYHAPVSEVY
jgi:hypothetical protein